MAFHLASLSPHATAGLVHIHANGAWTFDGGDDPSPYGWQDEPVVLTLEA